MSTDALTAAVLQAVGDARPVEVVGEGPLADAVRAAAGDRLAAAGATARPAAVVETSGAPDAIVAATERVADLGTVVLAGPPPADPVPLNLYKDLHARSVTLVGLGPD